MRFIPAAFLRKLIFVILYVASTYTIISILIKNF